MNEENKKQETLSSADKIKSVLEMQREFFRGGTTRETSFRKIALLKLENTIREHEREIFEALREDLGKSAYEAYETEIGMVYSEISFMRKNLTKFSKPEKVRTPLSNFPSDSRIYHEPYGTVLIMAPWNYPFQLSMTPLAGAIASGNCAVVKPSAYSPAVSEVIRVILEEAFTEDYVYTVTGGREANKSLLDEKFDYIFFTGGKEVGRVVMKAAAEHLTPVTLELGGKSPCIVTESADIALAARRIVWGKFLNCGQTCVAPDYILAHSSIKTELIQAILRNIEAMYTSRPLESKDYSKIINEKHYDRLIHLMEEAELMYSYGEDRESLKIGPAIIDEPSWDSAIMTEEIFGPLLPVISYEDIDEVKDAIENRPKPLALYLFTNNKKEMKYVLKNISFGGGCINDTIMHLANINLPFGGVGESGIGKYHGRHSFMTFTHEKSILKKSTFVDVPLRYPPLKRDTKWLRLFLK